MALYFALPFGVLALAKLCKKYNNHPFYVFLGITKLLLVFVLTFAAIWSPFLINGGF
jgi:hypothetical protein